MSDQKVTVLLSEADENLSFLVDRLGFTGPQHIAPVDRPTWDRSHAVRFTSVDFIIEVGLDRWATEVHTTICDRQADQNERALLEVTYSALGIGPPQDVPTRADTPHALRKHLRQQAKALEAVLEHLKENEPKR